MNNFYLYIFILCFIILSVSTFTHYYKYYVLKESFSQNTHNTRTIILLGDSIIKNNSYVKNGKAVDEILKEKTNGNSYCYAEDNSTIVDVYSQVSSIPIELNKESTTIFLSSGGNDILKKYVERDANVENTDILNVIFIAYKKLIKSIQTKMNKSKLVLIDIYYPVNIKYEQYKPILVEWNKLLTDFVSESDNLSIIKLSNELTDSTDFTLNIEPSDTGGEKIADQILFYY
jgi:hypothetical protein